MTPQAASCLSTICVERIASSSKSPVTLSYPLVEGPEVHNGIKKAMAELEVADFPLRYHGSSSLHHVYHAIESITGDRDAHFMGRLRRSSRREFWSVPNWLTDHTSNGHLAEWPHSVLERQLVDAYFDRTDIHPPLLDSTLFRQQLASGLALEDARFADVCWLVFALGARIYPSREVCWVDPSTGICDGRSAGWKYYSNVQKPTLSLLDMPDHYTLQVASLTTSWLYAYSSPHQPWLVAGTALRASQELGLHIAGAMSKHVTDYRAAKRAFWCLYHQDVQHSTAAGRRPIFREGDFDFDISIQGDESESIFNQMLLLDRIIAQALGTIYSVNAGSRQGGLYATIRQSSQAIDRWEDSLPSAFRYGYNEQSRFALNIAAMYVQSRFARILVWRPLLPTSRLPLPTSLEAMDHCLQAALDISQAIRRHLRDPRKPAIGPDSMTPIWTAQAILQMYLALQYDHQPESDSQQVHQLVEGMKVCVDGMRAIEEVWRYAGKLTDFMSETMRSLYNRYPHAVPSRTAGEISEQPGIDIITDQARGVPLGHGDDMMFANDEFDAVFAEVFGFVPSSLV